MDGEEDLSRIIERSRDSESRILALCIYDVKKEVKNLREELTKFTKDVDEKLNMYRYVLGIIITMLGIIMMLLLKVVNLVR